MLVTYHADTTFVETQLKMPLSKLTKQYRAIVSLSNPIGRTEEDDGQVEHREVLDNDPNEADIIEIITNARKRYPDHEDWDALVHVEPFWSQFLDRESRKKLNSEYEANLLT